MSCPKGKNHYRYKHGLSKHPLYFAWQDMKQRCYNKNRRQYKHWGGRGITVCNEWLHDFKVFYNWSIENGYKKGLQIDRIDNDGNYEPNNCHFVSQAENNRNSRTTKLDWLRVNAIRTFHKNSPHTSSYKAARLFGLSAGHVWKIWNNKSWKEQN